MENKKSSIFVIGIGITMSIVRVMIRESKDLTTIMAAVNIFALVFVVFLMLEKIKTKSCCQIDKFKIADRRKIPMKRNLKIITGITTISVFVIAIYFFLLRYCSNTGNDIMAIFALCVSIETDRLSDTVSNVIISNIRL